MKKWQSLAEVQKSWPLCLSTSLSFSPSPLPCGRFVWRKLTPGLFWDSSKVSVLAKFVSATVRVKLSLWLKPQNRPVRRPVSKPQKLVLFWNSGSKKPLWKPGLMDIRKSYRLPFDCNVTHDRDIFDFHICNIINCYPFLGGKTLFSRCRKIIFAKQERPPESWRRGLPRDSKKWFGFRIGENPLHGTQRHFCILFTWPTNLCWWRHYSQ